MAENTNIEKTFTYNIPDSYLSQSDSLKKTATWTYSGPRYIWAFADNSTGKIASRFHYTERDNGADVPTPAGMTKIAIDADTDPALASLFHNDKVYADLTHAVEVLPDGSTYGCPDPTPPDHTYELTEIQVNLETGETVKPYPWKQPHITWEELINVRNTLLGSSDIRYAQASDTDRPVWEEYRQKLRDITTTFAGVDPWKVPFPQEPFTTQAG